MLSYRKGFYIIPYLANSPEATVESFKRTPFVDWDAEKHLLTQKSPLLDGLAYFYEIEEGCWIYLSDITYKINVEFKMYFDESLPYDYYIFSYNLIKHHSKNKMAVVNGLSYHTFSWNIFKPKSNYSLANFKNTHNSSVGFYLSKQWIANNFKNFEGFAESYLSSFLNCDEKHTIWPELNFNPIFQNILRIIQTNDTIEKNTKLKEQVNAAISHIIRQYPINHQNNSGIKIESSIHLKLLLVEKELNDNLLGKFPGIDELAKKINMSPTKLKNDFKYFFGEPIYQYYLGKQMEYALILLRDQKMKVGEVAKIFSYQSEGKFTVAFKEKFGVLPSKVS